MKDTPSVGVIVGRFQVPELHDGHLELIRTVLSRHPRVLIFVGISAQKNATRVHPLDFETRRLMIQSRFPQVTVLPLEDKRTDESWSENLDKLISQLVTWGEVALYGSRDSFVPHYKGIFKPIELVLPQMHYNGTQIRAALTNTIKESYDYRAGIIHAVNNCRNSVHTTVDVAILHKGIVVDGPDNLYLCLGKKKDFEGWRFIGGYADIESASFEADAMREVYEETGLSVSSLQYAGSSKIRDWRYLDSPESVIKTILFVGWSHTLGGIAHDDIERIEWFPEKDDHFQYLHPFIVPEHQVLLAHLSALLKYNKKER